MSTHALPAASPADRTSLIRWIGAGLAAAALVVVLAVALWPASDVEKARADGKSLGEAVNTLYYADTTEEVDAALSEVASAASTAADHAGDYVGTQVDAQGDALSRAADGYVGAHTADSSFDQDLYQAELDTAVDDLNSQADGFRDEGPEVQQAFWDGYADGVSGA
jgi:hypothetical protein